MSLKTDYAKASDKIYVSSSFDATTHFETTCDDIIKMYEAITGKQLDFDALEANLDNSE